MNTSFEYITSLEYRLKAAIAEVMAFKSGDKYLKMQEKYLRELRHLERIIRGLKEELSIAHKETITVRNQWFEFFEELQKEYEHKLSISKKLNKQLEKRALCAEQQLAALSNKVTEQRHQIYDLETELEEEKGKNLKLRAQNNRDYENSSLPSSKSTKNKKSANSREKTGPGGPNESF
jgi:chromosome segregation ATPase